MGEQEEKNLKILTFILCLTGSCFPVPLGAALGAWAGLASPCLQSDAVFLSFVTSAEQSRGKEETPSRQAVLCVLLRVALHLERQAGEMPVLARAYGQGAFTDLHLTPLADAPASSPVPESSRSKAAGGVAPGFGAAGW